MKWRDDHERSRVERRSNVTREDHPNIDAEEALSRLRAGNQRWVDGKCRTHAPPAHQRGELTEGQWPFAVILGCADSRVPPELIFDCDLGELFVVRVAGNIAAPDISGSVEYAVADLGVQLVVVLGHEGCGAVTAALRGVDTPGDIRTVIEAIRPAVEASATAPKDERLARAIEFNVQNAVARLEADEPVLAGAVRAGKLRIVPALYWLDSGRVSFEESA